MRNVIITGGELFNKGAQAMTFITVDELRKRFPSHQIYLLSEMDLARPLEEREPYNFDFMGWYPTKFARSQCNPFLRLLCKVRNGKEFSEAELIYKNCDAIVDISGYALGSNWDYKNNNRYLEHLEFAQAFKIPVYLMPQSFGPFHFEEKHLGIDERCRTLLPTCKVILAREKDGFDALTATYGLTNVQLSTDLVLNNKGINLENVFKRSPEFKLPFIAPNSIAVIPNGRNLLVEAGKNVMDLYCTSIRHALAQGKTVYLLHHATADEEICIQLKQQFSDNERVILLTQEFSCLEFNELVKNFDYLVASRFHSIVHAYKNGVPCVILGWAKKYEDLSMQFEQNEYLFDVRKPIEISDLCEAMDHINKNREIESNKIMSLLSEVQKVNVFDVLNNV